MKYFLLWILRPRTDTVVASVLCALLAFCLSASAVRAEEQEETLAVMGSVETDTVGTGRFTRLVSRTPENVTVISAADIEAANAHTLSDVLELIPGIALQQKTGPVSSANII